MNKHCFEKLSFTFRSGKEDQWLIEITIIYQDADLPNATFITPHDQGSLIKIISLMRKYEIFS